VRGKFEHNVDPKDGYPIPDCINAREKRVLEFLVPIFYPEKPNRVTVTLGNTIFGSLSEEQAVDWDRIVRYVVCKLVAGVGKTKGSPISPFLYHLYKHEGLLKPVEETEWKTQEALLKYGESGSDSEPETQQESSSEPDHPREELRGLGRRVKTTSKGDTRSPLGKEGRMEERPESSSRIPEEDPFRALLSDLEVVQNKYYHQEDILWTISGLVAEPEMAKLAGAVTNSITDPSEIRRLEVENSQLKKELAECALEILTLNGKIKKKKRKEVSKRNVLNIEAGLSLGRIREVFSLPGDILNKTWLYEENKEATSGARIIKILVDFSEKVEKSLMDIRKLVSCIPKELRQNLEGV
jgi:hypothetical protein